MCAAGVLLISLSTSTLLDAHEQSWPRAFNVAFQQYTAEPFLRMIDSAIADPTNERRKAIVEKPVVLTNAMAQTERVHALEKEVKALRKKLASLEFERRLETATRDDQ